MQYIITSTTGGRHFEVQDDRQRPVGSMLYSTWLPNKAEISINDGTAYNMAVAGFWRMGVSITRNGAPYAELKFGLGRPITVVMENGTTLLFKKRSFWGSDFMLTDSVDQQLASVESEFKWRSLSFNYIVDVNRGLGNKDADLFLPFLMIYCARYMRSRSSAH